METNYLRTSMLDMVFENRNKAYGAYVLRQEHDKSLRTAIFFSFGAIFILLMGNFISEKMKRQHVPDKIIEVNVAPTDVNLESRPEIKPKIEPPKIQAAAIATVSNAEIHVVSQNEPVRDSIPETRDLGNAEPVTGAGNAEGTGKIGVPGGNGEGTNLEASAGVVPPTIYSWVSKMPEFPGGEAKLMQFLRNNTEYPMRERDLGVNAKMAAEFVVNEDGHISDIKILKSPSPGFDKEVMRVVRLLPTWKPGMQQDRPVKVRMVVPFTFKVND